MEDSENESVSMLLNESIEGEETSLNNSGNNTLDGSGHHDILATEATDDHDDGQLSQTTEDSQVETADGNSMDEKVDSLLGDHNDEFSMGIEEGDENETLMEEHEEGIEMTEDVDDSKEDGQTTGQEQEGESANLSDGTATEDFADDEFMAQTNPLAVQNEPPQQLMEDADTPGEGADADDAVDTHGTIGAEAIQSSESLLAYAEGELDETMEGNDNEGILLQQEDDPEQIVEDPLEAPLDNEDAEPQLKTIKGEVDAQFENQTQESAGELSSGNHPDETISLPLEDDATPSTEGFTILAGGDQLDGSLGGLEGKLVRYADGSVHLLTQESLTGMQLMEGDDKPEDQVNGEDAAAQMQLAIRAQLQEALLKQEKIKEEVEDREPEDELPSQDEPNAEGGALATLASAALGHQAPSNGVKSEPDAPESKPDPNEPQWMDVGICKGTQCTVRSFYIPSEGQTWDKNWEGINTATLPDHRALAKLELEAGKAYKFRVAAINSCGRGPWSEISAFRTSMPGVPGAPSAIKISKTTEGAHVSWEPPAATSGIIEDYTVYMAVRCATTDSQVVSSGANQLAFVRIYQGAENQCSIGFETLSEAHIDTTTKAAILFRIAARNDKGLGPAIQVRWLQDGSIPSNVKPANAVRRPGSEMLPHGSVKRKKSECE